MSSGERIPRDQAERIAVEIIYLILPYCERLAIVGSLRRGKPDVGDIELLAVPRLTERFDMFGMSHGTEVDALDDRCRELVALGVFQNRLDKADRPAFGSKYKRLLFQGVGLDLFAVTEPAEWGVLSIIRTGSADFSHRLVTPVEKGGWMPAGMVCRDGAFWNLASGSKFTTPEEHDAFAALGRAYVEPSEREV